RVRASAMRRGAAQSKSANSKARGRTCAAERSVSADSCSGLSYTECECNGGYVLGRTEPEVRGCPAIATQAGVTVSSLQPKPVSPIELLQACASACTRLKLQVGKVVIGQDQVVDNMLVALLGR